MDLFQAIKERRSVRSLEAVKIPKEDIEKILDAGRRAASGMNIQPFKFIAISEKKTIQKLAAVQECVGQASVVIAVAADPDASRFWLEDVAAATENMLLAITALGYASVWVEGTLLRREEEMKEILEVPENLRLMVFLPIGGERVPGSQPDKKPLEEMVCWERYSG